MRVYVCCLMENVVVLYVDKRTGKRPMEQLTVDNPMQTLQAVYTYSMVFSHLMKLEKKSPSRVNLFVFLLLDLSSSTSENGTFNTQACFQNRIGRSISTLLFEIRYCN